MPDVVYRSQHDSVLEAIRNWETQYEAFKDGMWAIAEEAGEGWEPFAWSGMMLNMEGLNQQRDGAVPDGPWRRTDIRGYLLWVPAKRTKEGKVLAKRIADLRCPARPNLPGMTTLVIHDGRWHEYGMDEDQSTEPSTVWVTWGCDPETANEVSDPKVDKDIWHRAKLSDYYLFKESRSAHVSAG